MKIEFKMARLTERYRVGFVSQHQNIVFGPEIAAEQVKSKILYFPIGNGYGSGKEGIIQRSIKNQMVIAHAA